jgi:1A family penicillin-binding protein
MANRRRPAARGTGNSFWRGVQLFFGLLISLVLVAVIATSVYAILQLQAIRKALPPLDVLNNPTLGGVTEIYATDTDPKTGKRLLLGRYFRQRQEFLPLKDIPVVVQNATIAIEDERFYSHTGVDFKGVVRALYRNFREGRAGEGASTLTQQLAKNLLLRDRTKSIDRKLKEMFLALQIEQNFSKEQILERYLNEVPYGNNTYGIKAASKLYFGKSVSKLSVAEASLLAGIPQLPREYELFRHRDAAKGRRKLVLAKMVELGYITAAERTAAEKQKLAIQGEPPKNDTNFKAPYFTNQVLRQLIARHGEELVTSGGLKVYTTLNYQMQLKAEQIMAQGIRDARGDGVTQGALVSVEPRTGYVRAMVGGRDFKSSQFNVVTQGRRQPGSTYKPIVYAAAFDLGRLTPDSEIYDGYLKRGRRDFNGYKPQNYGGGWGTGSTSVRSAIAFSRNVAAVRAGQLVGMDNLIDYSQRLGVRRGHLDKKRIGLSIALGAAEVTPLEMATVYATFANRGNRPDPMMIVKVVDNAGTVLQDNAPQIAKSMIGESAAARISECLAGVVEFGTASKAAGIHEVEGARGKTGTTSDNKDAWFAGYSPELVTIVWVCGERVVVDKKGKRTISYQTMPGVTGGQVCAPIWARFMKEAVPIQRQSGQSQAKLPEHAYAAQQAATQAALGPSPTPSSALIGLLPPAAAASVPESTITPPPRREPAELAPAPPTDDPQPSAIARTAPTPTPEPIGPPRRRRLPPAPTAPPTPRPDPGAREVTITVCVDSGRRATRWCPETIQRTMRIRDIPAGNCRLHRPRPGDE